MTISTETRKRLRNRRDQGGTFRTEIVAAAGRLLDETGRDDAITVRAVARETGISVPSIHDCFADRDAIIGALVEGSYVELIGFIDRAEAGVEDPAERLHAGCNAYLEYARTAPQRYKLLFLTPAAAPETREFTADDPGAAAFSTLVGAICACVRAGVSTSADAFADATALWAGLHGYASLRADVPMFLWPADDTVTDHLITALARLTPPR